MAEQSVSIVTLGCARNEVDSEELAGRLHADGFKLVDDPHDAETILVNTCGFVEQAKTDSINEVLATAELKKDGRAKAVIATGCLAERYGVGLAGELHEADAILGFDDYEAIGDRIRSVLAGETLHPLYPIDRRTRLPLAPAARPAVRQEPDLPDGVAPASGPRVVRRRLDGSPAAPVKLAGGCDRRCSFCAIPRWRGAFVSRRPSELIDEAEWLAGQGVRELYLVSENSTSYGKDLGDLRLLETMLPELAGVEGIERVRVSYLQPAEMRLSLVDAMTGTENVAPYFDLSFQHASAGVLRRMRRFGSTATFLDLLSEIRDRNPQAGVRTNVIVGFPGESKWDLRELERFLNEARFDVVGVFGYSDEEGTEAAGFDDKIDPDDVAERVERIQSVVDELVNQRAEERVGENVDVLIESADGEGRAAHQAPDVDGTTAVRGWTGEVGEIVKAVVVAAEGADLIADPV